MKLSEAMSQLRALIAAEVQDVEEINKLATDINNAPVHISVSIDTGYDGRLFMIPWQR